jgi:plasmid stabilization system protein ParE
MVAGTNKGEQNLTPLVPGLRERRQHFVCMGISIADFQPQRRKRETQFMPRGDKSKYTDKQKRKAEHIEESYEQRGVPEKEAASRAWATVNKESGGGNKSGSGRNVADTNVSSKKGGKKGGAASASRPAEARTASAKNAAATRKRNKAGKS